MSNQSNPQKTILLVEDDPFVYDIYEKAFRENNYQIIGAFDGEEGLRLSQKETYDLILLDIMLPKINGVALLKKIRESSKTKDVPIILLTNLGQESVIKEALRIGANGYLLKARLLPGQVVRRVEEFLKTGKMSGFDLLPER